MPNNPGREVTLEVTLKVYGDLLYLIRHLLLYPDLYFLGEPPSLVYDLQEAYETEVGPLDGET